MSSLVGNLQRQSQALFWATLYIYIYSSTCSKVICFGLLCYIFRQKITRNCEKFATIHAGDAGETVYIYKTTHLCYHKRFRCGLKKLMFVWLGFALFNFWSHGCL